MSVRPHSRPLRLVEASTRLAEHAWFCGHCAAPAPGDRPPAPAARVCDACGLGLFLETRADVAPAPDEPFIVVDQALRVQAMSERAQRLLGLCEEEAVDRPVASLLIGADTGTESQGLAGAVIEAAGGSGEPLSTYVRPWNTFGVRLQARIAPCGPPRAALIVLGTPRRQRLRAVSD